MDEQFPAKVNSEEPVWDKRAGRPSGVKIAHCYKAQTDRAPKSFKHFKVLYCHSNDNLCLAEGLDSLLQSFAIVCVETRF